MTTETGRVGESDSDAVAQAPVPVRSAPLRRKRKPARSAQSGHASAEQAPADEADATAVAGSESGAGDGPAGDGPGGEVSGAQVSGAGAAAADDAAPGEAAAVPIETAGAELSYRERRRRREAAAPAAGAAGTQTVNRSSALRRRTDRSVAFLVSVTLGVIVVIGALVASAIFAIGISRLDRQSELRAEYSSFAQQMTITMSALNPDNIDDAMKTMQDKTSGVAQQRLQQSMSQVADLVREMKDTVTAEVMTAAVTKATEDEGTVIMVYGWQSKPADPKEETILQTYRWRVEITRINGELKMTNYDWVV